MASQTGWWVAWWSASPVTAITMPTSAAASSK